jgi:cytochrome c oxidase cbb3-type subunit 3
MSDPEQGKLLFTTNCSPCHQIDGGGKPGLAPSIRNRDFLAIASDEFIRNTVGKGRVGTAMVPRPDLNDEAVGHIIAYLRDVDVPNPVTINVDNSKTSSGDAADGAQKYAIYCASCHGPKGEGYLAGGSGPGIGMPGFLATASDDYIFQTVKHGRIGTGMMGFIGATGLANLTEEEVHNIIVWLREK